MFDSSSASSKPPLVQINLYMECRQKLGHELEMLPHGNVPMSLSPIVADKLKKRSTIDDYKLQVIETVVGLCRCTVNTQFSLAGTHNILHS